MPKKSTKLNLDEPSAVETEAVTDAVEAAVEELAEMAQDLVDEATVTCVGPDCAHYSIEQDEEGELRFLCSAIPDEPQSEVIVGEDCIAPTLLKAVEPWQKLIEHEGGQLAVDVDTDADVRDQVRERLFNDVLKAQDAVSKAVDKLGDARQAQRAAETFLEKYDAWQANVTATISALEAELTEPVEDLTSVPGAVDFERDDLGLPDGEAPGSDEDVPGDAEPLDDDGGDETIFASHQPEPAES